MNSVGSILFKGKFNVVFGGQAGSEGKGKISCKVAIDFARNIDDKLLLSCNHMPNAGHTFRYGEHKYIARQLPTPAILNNKEIFGYEFRNKFFPVVLGPGSTINIKSLEEEIETCMLEPGLNLFIHPNAGIVTDEHLEAEGKVLDNVSSTKKGGGACLASKIMRQPIGGNPENKFAIVRDILPKHLQNAIIDTSIYINHQMERGFAALHEGAQGFDLDINHGLDYPYVTSRMSNVSAMLAESGISPDKCGGRIMVIRPYPIRVGDAYDKDGEMIGTSGLYADDNEELSWDKIKGLCGAPEDVNIIEKTTVTGKIRRVFTFSSSRFKKSMMVNDPTHIFITFADYIDYQLYKMNGYISDKVCLDNDKKVMLIGKIRRFVYENGIPQNLVVGCSTGPDNNDFIINDVW